MDCLDPDAPEKGFGVGGLIPALMTDIYGGPLWEWMIVPQLNPPTCKVSKHHYGQTSPASLGLQG